MIITYDYTEFIAELEDDLADGVLKEDDYKERRTNKK